MRTTRRGLYTVTPTSTSLPLRVTDTACVCTPSCNNVLYMRGAETEADADGDAAMAGA